MKNQDRQVVYRIRDWDKEYLKSDVARTSSEKPLPWVPIKTKHDGKTFGRLRQLPNEIKIPVFAAFVLLLETAAKMPVRGTLADQDGPLSSEDIEIKTGFPASIFDLAFKTLTDPTLKINWMEQVDWIPKDTPEYQKILSENAVYETGRDGTRRDEKKRTSSLKSDGFGAFWKEWPSHFRKKARSKCQRLWERKNLDTMGTLIVDAVKRFKSSPQWRKDSGQYIPGPEKWLNEESWEAEKFLGTDIDHESDNGETYADPNYVPPPLTNDQKLAIRGAV